MVWPGNELSKTRLDWTGQFAPSKTKSEPSGRFAANDFFSLRFRILRPESNANELGRSGVLTNKWRDTFNLFAWRLQMGAQNAKRDPFAAGESRARCSRGRSSSGRSQARATLASRPADHFLRAFQALGSNLELFGKATEDWRLETGDVLSLSRWLAAANLHPPQANQLGRERGALFRAGQLALCARAGQKVADSKATHKGR